MSSNAQVIEQDFLVNFLASIEFFSAFNRNELAELAFHAEIKTYAFGESVFHAGASSDGLYIIKTGKVRIFTEERGKEISMGIRKAGEVIAETAALKDFPYEYSVRASSRTELLFIPRHVFIPQLRQNKDAEAFMVRYAAIRTAGGFVTRLFDLKGKVDPSEVENLFSGIGIKRVAAGQVILEQNSREDRRLYVVRQGHVNIVRIEDGAEYPLATLGQGEVFGEKACLLQREQAASAIAETDATLLLIPEQSVLGILERNPKLKAVLEERIQFAERELQRQKKLTARRKMPVLLDMGSKPKRGERIIKRFPLIEQAEEMDCGAACLAMICKHYGIPMTLGKLRELANVTVEGATLESLARVGESLSFTTRGVQCTYDAMLEFELPFIAHWEGYHYVIVYGVSKQYVWVADPAVGFKKMAVADFERGWTGTCLLFTPGAEMAQLAVATLALGSFY